MPRRQRTMIQLHDRVSVVMQTDHRYGDNYPPWQFLGATQRYRHRRGLLAWVDWYVLCQDVGVIPGRTFHWKICGWRDEATRPLTAFRLDRATHQLTDTAQRWQRHLVMHGLIAPVYMPVTAGTRNLEAGALRALATNARRVADEAPAVESVPVPSSSTYCGDPECDVCEEPPATVPEFAVRSVCEEQPATPVPDSEPSNSTMHLREGRWIVEDVDLGFEMRPADRERPPVCADPECTVCDTAAQAAEPGDPVEVIFGDQVETPLDDY